MRPDPPFAVVSSSRLDSLTALRFFAALHVLLFHLQGLAALPGPLWSHQLLGTGFVSVSFFFVLSGFILTVSYAGRPPKQRLAAYAGGRFARLYPLYLLALLLMLPAWFKSWSVGPSLATPLLLQAWVPTWALAWNPPAWSLSVEAFFYVMFPFLLPVVLRLSSRKAWVLAVAGWFVGILFSVAYVWFSPDGLSHVDDATQAPWLNALKFYPLMRLPEFFVGMALGKSFLLGKWPRLGPLGGMAVGGLLLGLLYSSTIPYPLLHNGLFTPLFVAVIAAAAQRGDSVFRAIFEHRWLVILGEASYALYILQTPLLSLVHGVAKRLWPTLLESPLAFSAVALAVTVTASVIAWALIERPARQWLVQRFAR